MIHRDKGGLGAPSGQFKPESHELQAVERVGRGGGGGLHLNKREDSSVSSGGKPSLC